MWGNKKQKKKKKIQENMTPLKEINKVPITEPSEMEIYKLSKRSEKPS